MTHSHKKNIFASSEDSDLPLNPPSLISLAVCMKEGLIPMLSSEYTVKTDHQSNLVKAFPGVNVFLFCFVMQ